MAGRHRRAARRSVVRIITPALVIGRNPAENAVSILTRILTARMYRFLAVFAPEEFRTEAVVSGVGLDTGPIVPAGKLGTGIGGGFIVIVQRPGQ